MQYPVLGWHCAFVDTLWLSEHVAVIQLNNVKNSVFVLEKHCIFSEVPVVTEILIITSVYNQLYMHYRDFLMMARVVCRNMLENWQRVAN